MKQVICKVIDDIIDDIEMNDITEKEECVICFEIVDEESEDFKFDCDHKKYMHNACIKKVNTCPLCRTKSESNELIVVVRNDCSTSCGFLSCFILFVFLMFLLISPQLYPYYFFGNSNSTNIANSTNYNTTMIVI